MSQVFRYEQIIDLAGEIKPEQFDAGIEMAAVDLGHLVEEGLVVGALFFGSAAFKGTNPTSDIDTFVAVKNFDEKTVDGLQQAVAHVASGVGISLELTAYTLDQLKTGEHWERAAKVDWLKEQAEEYPELIVGANPIEFIAPLTKDLRLDVDEYLTNRAQEMTWSLIHGFQRNPEMMLEKVFNTPHRTARKTLHVLSFLGFLPQDTLPDMRKPIIALAAESVYGSHDESIVQHQQDIREDLERYLVLIDEVRRGKVDANEYAQMVHMTLAEDLPKAIDFVRRLQPIYRALAKITLD